MADMLTDKILRQQQTLQQAELLRKRQPMQLNRHGQLLLAADDRPMINFASNDYLGLSQSPELIEALYQGARDHGVGSTASPLVTGYSPAHVALEQALCELTGQEAALLFCSGFSANTALVKTLFGSSDRVIADKLIHASVIDGLRDSGAEFKRFQHNRLASAQQQLQSFRPSALLTESVFSMDGTEAPLAALADLCQSQGSWLIVDDAHGFGLMAATDIAHYERQKAKAIDVQLITFGKAMGCQGAAIVGSQLLVDFLVANARPYIYSTALSPANAAVARSALDLIIKSDHKRQKLSANIQLFRQLCQQKGIPLTDSLTAIQPVIIGDQTQMLYIAKQLKAQGFWVGAIRPPTVPPGTARLRITLSALHSQSDLVNLVDSLAAALVTSRERFGLAQV